jgi:hypothetical protein
MGGKVGIGTGTPTSTLHNAGSLSVAFTAPQTVDYVVADNDHVVLVNPAGPLTVTLPDPATAAGRVYVVKNISTTNAATVAAAAGTVEVTNISASGSYTYLSTGTDWIAISAL